MEHIVRRFGLVALAAVLMCCAGCGPSALSIKRPTLGETVEGSRVGGFPLGEIMPSFVKPSKDVTAMRLGISRYEDEATGNYVQVMGKPVDRYLRYAAHIEFIPKGDPGEARRLLIEVALVYGDRSRIRSAFFEPAWPADKGPRSLTEQLKFARLETREFVGWSRAFGAVHRTQHPRVFVGLTTPQAGDEDATQLGWIMRVATEADEALPFLKQHGLTYLGEFLKSDLGMLTALSAVERELAEAVTEGDVSHARRALPRPLPRDSSGASLLARQREAFAPLIAAVRAVPDDEASGAQPGATTPASQEPRLAGLRQAKALIDAAGGPGPDLPPEIREDMARRLQRYADNRRAEMAQMKTRTARETLTVIAQDAERAKVPARRDGGVESFISHHEWLNWAVQLWEDGSFMSRTWAMQRLTDVSDLAPETGKALLAITDIARPDLLAEARARAQRAETAGLPATAAAGWLLVHALEQGRKGLSLEDPIEPWNAQSAGDGGARGKARALIATLGSSLIPALSGERERVDDGDWPIRKYLRMALKYNAPASTLGPDVCTVAVGPMRYAGNQQVETRISEGGDNFRRVEHPYRAQTRGEWQSEVTAMKAYIADLERQSEPSLEPLGREVKGQAASVQYLAGPNGTSYTRQLDWQNTYRIGVAEAAREQAARMAAAKAKLPSARYDLAQLIKQGPRPAGIREEYVPDGTKKQIVEKFVSWDGKATRVLEARCAGAQSVSAEERFDIAERSKTSRKDVPKGGYTSREYMLERIGKADRQERDEALMALMQKIIASRIDTWRGTAQGAAKEELDEEAIWRSWFFGVSKSRVLGIPMTTGG